MPHAIPIPSGLDLLQEDTDKSRRLALLSIDNAVELIIKTYLGLPKRAYGLQIKRSEYQDFSESFPRLLDALERYAPSHLIIGIDLADIEYYHRLRNQLYHHGNGLTVDQESRFTASSRAFCSVPSLAMTLVRQLARIETRLPPSCPNGLPSNLQ